LISLCAVSVSAHLSVSWRTVDYSNTGLTTFVAWKEAETHKQICWDCCCNMSQGNIALNLRCHWNVTQVGLLLIILPLTCLQVKMCIISSPLA